MKANAPEKIFLEREKETNRIHNVWGGTPVVSPLFEHIEYIRKDVFIDKAKKWFEESFMNVHKWEISTYEFENIQSMIDEFRKYMKGE
jgi:hypothetical protein